MPKFEIEDVTLDVTYNRETITVHGYTWEDAQGDDTEDDYEPAGEYLTSDKTYSGYTMPECLCLSLIDLGRADDWSEAIAMIEAAGIEYISSDEED